MNHPFEAWNQSAARWIDLPATHHKSNAYVQFVRDFDAPPGEPLHLRLTATQHYKLWLNGEFIGRGPAVSDLGFYYYDEYTVHADQLRPTGNRLAVLAYNEGKGDDFIQKSEFGRLALLAQVDFAGQRLVTDTTWRARVAPEYSGSMPFDLPGFITAPKVSYWGGYKEYYHGDKARPWLDGPLKDGDWQPVRAFAEPESPDHVRRLVPLDTPRLETFAVRPGRLVEASANLGGLTGVPAALPHEGELPVITFEPGEPGAQPAITVDFGRMMVGYPRITTRGGFHIYEVHYGESLDLYRLDVVRQPGDATWEAYPRRSFRYLQVRMIAQEGPVSIEGIELLNSWYAYNGGGHSQTGDAEVDRIVETSNHTLRVNTSYHYEDCPWREQALWIFDMRLMAMMNYYHYGNPEVVAKCLRQCFAIQRPDGSVPSAGPRSTDMKMMDFCMHLVSTLREYHDYTGDDALVAELRPAVERVHAYMQRWLNSDGLLDQSAGQPQAEVFLDWSTELDKGGANTVLNAVYSTYLEDLATLREVAGHGDADELRAARRLHRERVNAVLREAASGLYRDTFQGGRLSEKLSMQGNMAALHAGFVDEDKVGDFLAAVLEPGRFKPPFGPSFYLMIFEALGRLGQTGQILEFIRWYWGSMLARGASTVWEVYDPTTPDWVYPHPFLGNVPTYELEFVPVSTCHGWSGAPSFAVPRHLFGVDLLTLGQGRVEVRGDLRPTLASYDYKVPVCGEFLHLKFEAEGNRYKVETVQAPSGIEVVQKG